MFLHSNHVRRGVSGSGPSKRMRRGSGDDDDFLLPVRSTIPPSFPMVQTELKFLDTYMNYRQLSVLTGLSGGILTGSGLVSVPLRGDGPSNFNGRGFVIKNWSLRGSFDVSSPEDMITTPDGRMGFVAMILDTQTNGTQCLSEDIFTNPGGTIAAMCSPMVNLLNSDRYVVLRRETVVLNSKTMTVVAPTAGAPSFQQAGIRIPFEFFVPLDLPVVCKAFNGNIGDIVNYSLHIVFFASYYDTTILAHEPITSAGYSSRIRFLEVGV